MRDWESRWRNTWRELGLQVPDDVLARSLADLLLRYREPQRHYHTVQHLDECFAAFDLLHAEAPHPGEVGLALWFHDAVYDPQARDNEARSASLALECMREAKASTGSMERVADLIMATRHHDAADDPDRAVLLDIDLSILAAPPARFAEYERQIRAEYAHVPLEAYRAGRARVLRGFLERPRIYATACFRDRYEEAARTNLEHSLRA